MRSLISRLRARLAAVGIRERLLLLVLAMLGPWIALFATTFASYDRVREAETRNRMAGIASQVSARLGDQVGTIEALLLALAQSVVPDSSGVVWNDDLLRRVHGELPPYFNNLGVWSADGRNVGLSAARGEGDGGGVGVGGHQFFRSALAQRGLVISAAFRRGDTGAWSLTLARSIRRTAVDGDSTGTRADGIVSATARLDGLGRLLDAGERLPSGAVITLIDERGTVLSRTADAARWVGEEAVTDTIVHRLRASGAGFEQWLGLDSVPRLVAYQATEPMPWVVLVGFPAGMAIGPQAEWRTLALVGVAGFVGALLLAALVAGRIADPLRHLTADAARFGAGELTARTDVRTGGEVGALAATFNQMAATLHARTAALAASEERHQLAAKATNDVVWDWDVSTSRVTWSDGAAQAFHLPAEGLGHTIEWWQERIHCADRARAVGSLTDALDSDTSLWSCEYRFEVGDGTYAEILDRGYVLRDASGTPQRVIGSMLDLTERRSAERERDRFFSLSGDMFCIASFEGAFLRVNPAFGEVLGYTTDELLATPIMKLIHPDDRDAAREGARQLARGLSAQRYENRFRCRDGSYRWLAWTVQSAGEASGRIYAVARDVTEHRKADDRLRASEEWYRLLFYSNPLPMWVYDVETLAFLAVNEAAIARYGWSREEFLAMRITDIRPEEDVPALAVAARAPVTVQHPRPVWRHRTRDGAVFLAEVVTHDIAALDRPSRLTIAHDVTEKERAERALRETNDTLQTLIQASPLAIVTTDVRGIVTEWNIAAERMFGWMAGDVLGQPLPIVAGEQGSDAPRPSTASVSGEQSLGGFEMRAARRDGSFVDVYVSTATLRGAGGMVGTMWVMADVTERKLIEEQLRQAQKMDAVGQLAGGVAHDFNNLLTVITSYGQFLLNALPEQDPRHADARQVTQAAARAASLTRQLLAFSRRQLLQPQILDLNEVVGDMQKLLGRVISENISLVTQLEPGLGAVRADRGQLEQVIMNLVVNARDAMPAGGVLSIGTRVVQLDAKHARRHAGVAPGRYVMLAVRDTGVGMDAATQSRIFEPFFTTKEKGRGTGLGLSTVYGIVRQSGGHVEVRSVPGRGSAFEIYLPHVAALVPTRTESVGGSELPSGNEAVLVVEDEEALRVIVRRVLAAQGYRILEARNGHEALRLCEEHGAGIDLVLTDVIMPGMGGHELARTLAARRAELPVIFMSGYSDDGELGAAGLGPGSVFITKPFTADTLARRVRDVLDQPRQRAAAEAVIG